MASWKVKVEGEWLQMSTYDSFFNLGNFSMNQIFDRLGHDVIEDMELGEIDDCGSMVKFRKNGIALTIYGDVPQTTINRISKKLYGGAGLTLKRKLIYQVMEYQTGEAGSIEFRRHVDERM